MGLLWLIIRAPIVPVPLEQQRHYAGIDLAFVHSIAANANACRAIELIGICSAVLFLVGWHPRRAYVVLALTFAVGTLVRLERGSAHDWGVPLITMLGWLAVPWGEGHRVLRLTFLPEKTCRRAYGFAVFWPGLVLGTALAAAAYAKLSLSGFDWITSGAVRYHFVTDAQNAPLDWGLTIAASQPLSIAASALTIVFEATFVLLIVLGTGPLPRLVAGLGAAIFFIGLYLLQGVWWDPWLLVLLPAFLPWEWLGSRVRGVTAASLPLSQRLCVLALVGSQLIASLAAVEREPLLSNYPMYAHTYESPAEFDRQMSWRFTEVHSVLLDDRDHIDEWPKLAEETQRWLMSLGEGTDIASAEDVVGICADLKQWTGTLPDLLQLNATRGGFDWAAGEFRPHTAVVAKPIQVGQLCRPTQVEHQTTR